MDPNLPVIGRAMRDVVAMLEVFARQDETILLSGPTGAGKSRLAGWCHARSGRTGLFQTVDLLSMPDDLQMAELFGWKKGSFTGATHDRDGCIARAEGGTLFIDEIDKLSLKAQASLLHLLETRQYRVLGDPGNTRSADVRFVVGTNADLMRSVADGRFREDLYYRIHVLPVRVPSLAERRDEIPEWARFMLARRHGHGCDRAVVLDADAASRLCGYDWPGNLRQLDNVVRRAYALALIDHSDGEVRVAACHVDRALAIEQPASSRHDLMQHLTDAARAFFAEARRRAESGATLDLVHAAAFCGLVVQAGVEELGDLKEAYRVLGNESAVKSRNYQREYRRELERVERLAASLGAGSEPAASARTSAIGLLRPERRGERAAAGQELDETVLATG